MCKALDPLDRAAHSVLISVLFCFSRDIFSHTVEHQPAPAPSCDLGTRTDLKDLAVGHPIMPYILRNGDLRGRPDENIVLQDGYLIPWDY